MACFAVSAAGAASVAIIRKIVKHKENKNIKLEGSNELTEYKFGCESKWSKKLAYLELGLGAGSILLLGEHIIHGEISFIPPFFTAAKSAEEFAKMWYEIGTVGVAMFFAIIFAWLIGIFTYDFVKYKKHKNKVSINMDK